MEARDERRLLKLQRDLQATKLLIIDELGYVPLTSAGAELLFEVFSKSYERGSAIVTSNLPFEDWTSVLGSERLTGALLDRLTHQVSILTMNGDSYRLKQSADRRRTRSGPFAYRHAPPSLACFYSAPMAWNPTGVDIWRRKMSRGGGLTQSHSIPRKPRP